MTYNRRYQQIFITGWTGKRLAPELNSKKLVIQCDDLIRVDQIVIVPGVGEAWGESKNCKPGFNFLEFKQVPYQLLVRSQSPDDIVNVALSLWLDDSLDIAPNPDWEPVTLNPDWIAFGGSFFNPAYLKQDNLVYLRGATRKIGSGHILFTLPIGYRPSSTLNIPVTTNDGINVVSGNCQILSNGDVSWGAQGGVFYFGLDGVVFGVDQ
jgi:hypothetical protein